MCCNYLELFLSIFRKAIKSDAYLCGTHFLNFYILCRLHLSGSSASEYENVSSLQVKFLSSDGPLTAPFMEGVKFSDAGTSMFVKFDVDTDKANFTQGWACNELFAFVGADSSNCFWKNASFVEAIFGSGGGLSGVDLITPGSRVTILSGKLRAACKPETQQQSCAFNIPNTEATLVAEAPTNPIRPLIVIDLASVTSFCVDTVLDASTSFGNGGRQWESVVWSVEAEDHRVDVGPIASLLADSDISRPITIPHQLLNITTYTYTLQLVNYLVRLEC
jgi:hypothetical protein